MYLPSFLNIFSIIIFHLMQVREQFTMSFKLDLDNSMKITSKISVGNFSIVFESKLYYFSYLFIFHNNRKSFCFVTHSTELLTCTLLKITHFLSSDLKKLHLHFDLGILLFIYLQNILDFGAWGQINPNDLVYNKIKIIVPNLHVKVHFFFQIRLLFCS